MKLTKKEVIHKLKSASKSIDPLLIRPFDGASKRFPRFEVLRKEKKFRVLISKDEEFETEDIAEAVGVFNGQNRRETR